MERNILRMGKPMVCTHTIYGAVSATATEKDIPFFYNNFTQIMFHPDWNMFIFEDHQKLLEICPFIKSFYYMMDPNCTETEFIEKVTCFIDCGYYIYIFLDRSLITPEIFTEHYAHTTLISGYDRKKHIFFLSDNYDDGKFVTIERDMSITARAFRYAKFAFTHNIKENDGSDEFSYLCSIGLYKYLNEVIVGIDMQTIAEGIKAYLNSKKNDVTGLDNTIYGAECSNLFIGSFSGKNDFTPQKRDLHIFYEHKLLMYKRIKYLVENKLIDDVNDCLGAAERIMEDHLIARNLFIKSTFLPQDQVSNIYAKISSRLEESFDKELNMLKELLTELH